jgi:SPP1 gp7 family putative phage head morphogenesis protein
LILKDMDLLESAFLKDAQRLNKKRQDQMLKRVSKILPELYEAHEKGDTEEVEAILKSIQMPSAKEWNKIVYRLIENAVKAGIARAHSEVNRLRELYEFAQFSSEYGYDVVIPEGAQEWLKKYGYEIGIITSETARQRIVDTVEKSLLEGLTVQETQGNLKETMNSWIGDFHAKTIARTETAKMYNAGRIARYLDPEQDGFVEALQYDAIVDNRTTDLCRHLDGKIIAVSNASAVAKYTPPNHFMCRATWMAISKYEEWEDDFPTDMEPDKGFQFEPQLPKLLQGKKANEKLVQPTTKRQLSPWDMTDPEEIKKLKDDEFRQAIGNIEDMSLRLEMILERAEDMLKRVSGLKEVSAPPKFTYWGDMEDGTALFEFNNIEYSFSYDGSMASAVGTLVVAMQEASKAEDSEQMNTVIDEFVEEYGGQIPYLDLALKLRQAQAKGGNRSKVTWKGLNPVENRSPGANNLLTIQTPLKVGEYGGLRGLQRMLEQAEQWMKKYIHNRLAPSTGIKLVYESDNERAFARGDEGTIHFGKSSSGLSRTTGTIIHESAHVMHWNNKDIANLIHEFFLKRTDDLQKPKGDRYGEEVIPDDFISSYTGRIYGWEAKQAELRGFEGFHGQEVFSMGLEMMYNDPMKFYREDPEHFKLTYAILMGVF